MAPAPMSPPTSSSCPKARYSVRSGCVLHCRWRTLLELRIGKVFLLQLSKQLCLAECVTHVNVDNSMTLAEPEVMLQYKGSVAAVTNVKASICKHASEPQSMLLYMWLMQALKHSHRHSDNSVDIRTGPRTQDRISPEASWNTDMLQHVAYRSFHCCNLLFGTARVAMVGSIVPVSSPARFEKFSHSLQ